MPDQLEYIVKDALMMCDKGSTPVPFTPTSNTSVKISGCLVTTKADKLPGANIPPFGACAVRGGNPCTLIPTEWTDTYKVKVKGQETLLYKSKLMCGTGGKIEFVTTGQVKLPPEEYDKLMGENTEEEGLSWWDAAEMIPFVGGVIGVIRSAAKDPTDWLGVGLSAVSVVADVAGLFSFGAGNAASAGIKSAKLARVAAKAAKVAKKTGKAVKFAKGGAKAFAKGAAKVVDDIAMKTGKVCVFACFPKGTTVHTEKGKRTIETIKVGDLVWAWDEQNNNKALKKVVSTKRVETDVIIELHTINGDIIKTTPTHPFKTDKEWRDAADLKVGDILKTFTDTTVKISKVLHLPKDEEVFNFHVEDFHTYYVGDNHVLVHNACENNVKNVVNKLLKGEGKVGKYSDLIKKGKKGDNITPHHMPSDKYMRSKGVKKKDGISMNMEQPSKGGRHRKTKTHGRNMTDAEKKAYYEMSPRDALAKDIKDARKIYKEQGMYNKEIQKGLSEVIKQNKKTYPNLFNK